MNFDEYGYPKPNGATDWADSPHLAGILEFVNHPQKVDCTNYVIGRKYVRHPKDGRYDVSRDQAILLMYGLYKQGFSNLVDLNAIDGKDLYSPAVRGFVRIMKDGKAYFWERWWMSLDLWFNRTFQKLEEPFQILVMADVYGPKYLNRWITGNTLWRWSIRRYFAELDGRWRDEPELAEMVIKKTEEKVLNGA